LTPVPPQREQVDELLDDFFDELLLLPPPPPPVDAMLPFWS
jgi:hypothetical protein